jgi:hypothetical protein
LKKPAIDAVHPRTQNAKQPWQTPLLKRSDAADAEATPGASTDSPITTS